MVLEFYCITITLCHDIVQCHDVDHDVYVAPQRNAQGELYNKEPVAPVGITIPRSPGNQLVPRVNVISYRTFDEGFVAYG